MWAQKRLSKGYLTVNCLTDNCRPENCSPVNCPPENCSPVNCPPENCSPVNCRRIIVDNIEPQQARKSEEESHDDLPTMSGFRNENYPS